MATLAAADLSALSASVSDQFGDAADLVPDGSSVAAQVASVAPGVVDTLNVYAGTTFGQDSLAGVALPATALAIVEVGVKARLLRNAYRTLTNDEKEWYDAYQTEFDRYLDDLRAGRIGLPDSTAEDAGRAAASASEPRRFSGDAAWVAGDTDTRVDLRRLY